MKRLGSIPLFVGLNHGFKLLGSVGRDEEFSPSAVRALRTIKVCAIVPDGFVAGAEVFAVITNLDVMLARRKMSLTKRSERVGTTIADLSILKTGKTKALRFSTLAAMCRALDCRSGDILECGDAGEPGD